mgnify:CR=1 FL=1
MNPKWIIGKTVASVDMQPYDDGRGGTAHDPVITFTDGSSIRFQIEDTEGAMGVDILYFKPPKEKA